MTSLPAPPTVLASSSSHLLIASGSSLQLYHPSSSSPTSTSTPFKSLITHAALSPSSTHAVAAYEDKSLCTFSLSEGTPRLLHTRQTVKRVSALSFADDKSIIVSDKVGDVFLYPLEPRVSDEAAKDRARGFALIADPTLNPDADLLAGHVSVVTSHLLAPGGKRLITADRDEHIRISRYPRADVIEKYLFGTDGFVSAVHIPVSKPELLLSAGGERWLRIWDWAKGDVAGRVDIMEAILPHRRVRSAMRRLKRAPKRARVEEGTSAGETAESSFYEAPEGWLLPSGQGVCVKKIDSVQVGDQMVVLFFSEGAAALHAFNLSETPGKVETLPLPHPLLDFAPIPGSPGRLLVSLDTAWGVLKQNPGPGTDGRIKDVSLSAEQTDELHKVLSVVEVSSDGKLSLIQSDIAPALQSALSSPETLVAPSVLSNLALYPSLSLLPRWPGMEEDDDLAGPPGTAGAGPNSDAPASSASEAGEPGAGRTYTPEELEGMNVKQLGRLRAQGVDVDALLREKRKAKKAKKGGSKLATVQMATQEDDEEEVLHGDA